MIKFKDFIKEDIKGWKNAASDIAKMRTKESNSKSSVRLHKLNLNGKESGMHDASTYHNTEEDAHKNIAYRRSINPGKKNALEYVC
jgi:hypothetical protein